MGDKNQSPNSSKSNRNESHCGCGKSCGSHGEPLNPRNERRRKTDKEEEETLEVGEDRISELPDSLLLHILSVLPALNQVIRTGTLSKRWINLWNFVPNLVFTLPLADFSLRKLVSDVNRILIQSRVSKVENFSIRFPYHSPFSADVDSWVHFATTNNVEHLTLSFEVLEFSECYALPQHLYTYSSLKTLELSYFIIAPSGLIRWKLLRSLSLCDVMLSNAVMEEIFSGCPVLEILQLYCYCGINRLKVTCPSLRELVLSVYGDLFYEDDDDAFLKISAPHLCRMTISSCFYTWNICLDDVRSLVAADLSFFLDMGEEIYPVEEYDKYLDLVQELIGKLHHVKELKLGTWCIQVLSVLELQGLPSPLLNCESLTLDMHIAEFDLPGIAKLLDISPYLETLVISTENLYPMKLYQSELYQSFDGENYLQSRKTIPECLSLHLKKVKIFGYRRRRWEVELIQFLLKNAKVLENMDIYLQREDFKCKSYCCGLTDIVNELIFPVSSSHAVVRFFESPEEFVEALKLERMLFVDRRTLKQYPYSIEYNARGEPICSVLNDPPICNPSECYYFARVVPENITFND